MELIIQSLRNVKSKQLYNTFSSAFENYERTWSQLEFENMLRRRHYAADLSFGAFDKNDLVSFTLNGIAAYNGKRTAYDTGTGTLNHYSGKGLATKIFAHSIPFLKSQGVEQYLLEALTNNSRAISVYTSLGFEVSRELDYYIHPIDKTATSKMKPIQNILLKEIEFSLIQQMSSMWDVVPSWQNNFNALMACRTNFKVIGAFSSASLIGYGVIEPGVGDIPQLAVVPGERKKGVGSLILNELLKHNQTNVVKLIDLDNQNAAIKKFLFKNGIAKSGSQFEMIKNI